MEQWEGRLFRSTNRSNQAQKNLVRAKDKGEEIRRGHQSVRTAWGTRRARKCMDDKKKSAWETGGETSRMSGKSFSKKKGTGRGERVTEDNLVWGRSLGRRAERPGGRVQSIGLESSERQEYRR